MPRTATNSLMACTGYSTTLTTSDRPTSANKSPSRGDKYYGKQFFDDKNYKSILECLDGGYQILKDLLEYMQDYCNVLNENIKSLTLYSRKWTLKVEQQSLLSSYNTTKSAQLEVVRAPERHAELIQARFAKVQTIIKIYTAEVERMYPRVLLSITHKHYRTDAMRNLFKAAYSSLSDLSSKREKLREQEKLIVDTLSDDDAQYQTKQQKNLKDIREVIERTERKYEREKVLYRERLTNIYEECRALEQERLDLMRETLIKFIKEAFSFENVTQQRQIYEDLSSMLQIQQNSSQDLDFWAQAYGVFDSRTSLLSANKQRDNNDCNKRTSNQTTSRKPKKSQECETLNLTTTEILVNKLRIEDDEAEDDK